MSDTIVRRACGPREGEISRLSRILLIVYFLETGLVLLVAPWSTAWERNLFVEMLPSWGSVARLHGVRGTVSGVGLVSLAVGLWELSGAVGGSLRRRRETGGEPPVPSAGGVDRALAKEAGSWSRKL
jgi:hypothetical protein